MFHLCCNIVILAPSSKHAFVCAASKLQRLVVLEAEHGPLPGTTPAITDILNYLENVIVDVSIAPQHDYSHILPST